MRVLVLQMGMSMPVRVRRLPVRGLRMLVLMVFVMHMGVRMFYRLMHVFVLMVFGEMQPDAEGHQSGRRPECRRRRFAEQDQRDGRADERGGRKVGPGTRRAEAAQGQHEENEADAVASQTGEHRQQGAIGAR